MIIYENKGVETRSDKPNEDWTGEALYVVPDGSELAQKIIQNYPYYDFVVQDGRLTDITPTGEPVEVQRQTKTGEISAACNAAILAGVDVDTAQGTEHFSMQETDQINMQLATAAVQAGASGYPYHADGQLCRIFTAQEIKTVGDAMIAHKMYHTTYCNHMFEWIRRAEGEELQNIQYGAGLPDDLKASMEAVLKDAANM